MLTHDQVLAFDRDGFVLAPAFFSPEETAILLAHARERTRAQLSVMEDATGRASKLQLWMELQEDVFAAVVRHPRMLASVHALLREECYHWHSKVMVKEPEVGGAWEWHQDYGYWYLDGCPYPRLVSCLIALDRADRSNGCLQVMPGSHLLGRIDHGQRGQQWGADPQRIQGLATLLPTIACEAEPGTALFFHCNLLHSSAPNTSPRPRTSFIACYNGMSNRPILGRGHGQPVRIAPGTEDAICRIGPPPALTPA